MFIIVTLKDIAQACNVSISTVSRAFDKTSRISQPVRQRILACAADMGYTPNLIARSLKNNHSMTVAIIVPSIENHFYIDVLQYLEIKLHQYGYRLLVTFVQEGITTEWDCLEVAASAQADALIFFPEDCRNLSYIEKSLNQFSIIQLFQSPYMQIDSITIDDAGGTEIGTNYLLDKGHRRILYVGDNQRISGLWKAIDSANVVHDSIRTLTSSVTVNELCDIIQDFHPTAVFSIATASETVWLAIRQLGLSIPDDISIITYDNSKWVSLVGLTAIAHDLEKITSLLVAQLLLRLKGDTSTPPQHIVISPFLIERSSVLKIN